MIPCLAAFGVLSWLTVSGSSGASTFAAMVFVGLLVQGAVPLFLVLIASETVQDRLRGKAVGLVDLGTTAIGGGAFAVLIGVAGTAIGLHDTFLLGIGACLVAGILAAVGIVETHPRRV